MNEHVECCANCCYCSRVAHHEVGQPVVHEYYCEWWDTVLADITGGCIEHTWKEDCYD